MQITIKVVLAGLCFMLAAQANACDLSKHRGGGAGHAAAPSQFEQQAESEWADSEAEAEQAQPLRQPRVSRQQQASIKRAVRAQQQRLLAEQFN